MRELATPFRTENTPTIQPPDLITRQLLVALYGGQTLWDPVTATRYCLVCLNDVPCCLLFMDVAACCL